MLERMIRNTDPYDILIVDDTRNSLELLTRLLEEQGYRVRPATSGRLALKSVAAKLPDLVLLDVKMPEMDGYEVCRRLKSNEHSRHVPVIFISAHGEIAKKVEGFNAGGVDFIAKPFEREEVLARVKTHLRIRDLTWRLEEAKASLERRVEERTAALNQANREVMSLKNYLSNIIDSMPAILVGIDRHETVTQWNRQAEELTGITATSAIGRPILQVLPDFSAWISALRRNIEQQRHAVMEHRVIEREGERRFYDLLLYPLIANGVEGAVIRIEDVTEQTRLRELMIQTEKMMSIGGLAAGMAHEINNPLHIITQAAQNIERRVSPDIPANRQTADALGLNLEQMQIYLTQRQIPEFLGSIHSSASRTAKIVANMLRFSRLAETAKQPASLADIQERAVELASSDYDLKKRYDFRNIEIVRDYAPELPEVMVVTVEIEQVLLNLLKNAAQAMSDNPPERPPRITLRLRREDRYAVIEVEDNGPGMDEIVRRRIFEPFFTTKDPDIGTGLGLSVSYMIITQNHKGLIEVASTPDKGSCFTVRLPLASQTRERIP